MDHGPRSRDHNFFVILWSIYGRIIQKFDLMVLISAYSMITWSWSWRFHDLLTKIPWSGDLWSDFICDPLCLTGPFLIYGRCVKFNSRQKKNREDIFFLFFWGGWGSGIKIMTWHELTIFHDQDFLDHKNAWSRDLKIAVFHDLDDLFLFLFFRYEIFWAKIIYAVISWLWSR